jgi:hypothetical protein
MPLQPGQAPPRSNLPPKGASKSRRYAVAWVPRKQDSKDETGWYWEEVKSTNCQSATNALLKKLREKYDKPEMKKTGLVVLAMELIPARQTLEEYLGLVEDDAEDEEAEEEDDDTE